MDWDIKSGTVIAGIMLVIFAIISMGIGNIGEAIDGGMDKIFPQRLNDPEKVIIAKGKSFDLWWERSGNKFYDDPSLPDEFQVQETVDGYYSIVNSTGTIVYEYTPVNSTGNNAYEYNQMVSSLGNFSNGLLRMTFDTGMETYFVDETGAVIFQTRHEITDFENGFAYIEVIEKRFLGGNIIMPRWVNLNGELFTEDGRPVDARGKLK